MKIFLSGCIFLLSFLQAAAQNIDSAIERYGTEYSQEKTYLHFDKSTYAPGETIWFKAYILNGIYPSDESKNFYVDWSDEKGKLLSHSVFPVVYPHPTASSIYQKIIRVTTFMFALTPNGC